MSIPSNKDVKTELAAALQRSSLLGRPGFLIRRLHQIHCGLFSDETREHNITPVQYSLMTALHTHGEMDQNSLALEIGLERTSVAEVIPRLEARELLVRRQSPTDKRVKLVKLSRKGLYLLKRMQESVERAHERTVESLPEDERDLFMLQMIRLVEANNAQGSAPFRLDKDGE